MPNFINSLKSAKEHIELAMTSFQAGKIVAIADDGARENEIDLCFSPVFSTKEKVNFILNHAKGLVCIAVDIETADRLGFYSAPHYPAHGFTNFSLSVDARNNITSGISAQDRSESIRLIGDLTSTAADFVCPGHVFPVLAREHGVFTRAGHTETCVDFAKLSNMPGSCVMSEILDGEGNSLPTSQFKIHAQNPSSPFRDIPMFSTTELFWYKLISFPDSLGEWEHESLTDFDKYVFKSPFCCEMALFLPKDELKLHPSMKITAYIERNSYQNKGHAAHGEIIFSSLDNLTSSYLDTSINDLVDLSRKEGFSLKIKPIKKFISLLIINQFFKKQGNSLSISALEWPELFQDSLAIFNEIQQNKLFPSI